MTRHRIRSNITMAIVSGLMMATGAWMITNAPSDSFAILGLAVAIAGVTAASILAMKVSQ